MRRALILKGLRMARGDVPTPLLFYYKFSAINRKIRLQALMCFN